MGFTALLRPSWDSGPLQGRFDVIGFDPRGVGASTPRLDCYTDAEYDTGQVFGAGERLIATYTGYLQAFTELATECAAGADCPLGPDPARATEAFHAIVRPLQDRPATTTDGRGLTYSDAMTGALTGLRAKAQWPTVVQGLAELAAGRGDVLLGLRDGIYGRDPDGRYVYDGDALTGISCMDRPRRTPAEQTDLAQQLVEANPLLDTGRPVTERHDECAAWPEPPSRPEPWLTGDVDVPPVLIVSVTGDPVTPHQGGINMARSLGASLLTVEGTQHGVALFGQSKCVDDIVGNYLITLQTPPDDARCTLEE